MTDQKLKGINVKFDHSKIVVVFFYDELSSMVAHAYWFITEIV